MLLTVSEEEGGKCEPKRGANLFLPWATELRIESMLEEPNYKHCNVNYHGTGYQPCFPGERLQKHPRRPLSCGNDHGQP